MKIRFLLLVIHIQWVQATATIQLLLPIWSIVMNWLRALREHWAAHVLCLCTDVDTCEV